MEKEKLCKNSFMLLKSLCKVLGVHFDNIVFSKLVKRKTNFKYWIGYLDKALRSLILIMPKMRGYVKTVKVKEGDKDKNNKLMSFRIDDEKLLERFKAIWNKIEDLKNIKCNALPGYDDRYAKIKIRAYGDKVYTKIRSLNVPEDDTEREFFTVISIDSLLVYENKFYLQVYLDNCVTKLQTNN